MTLATPYARAIEKLLQQGSDPKTIVEKLRTHLAAKGRLKLLPQLLRELRTIEARRGANTTKLEIASEADRAAAEAAARAQGVEAKATVNPDLIRGWRLTANGMLTDHSAKRSLVEMYRRIAT